MSINGNTEKLQNLPEGENNEEQVAKFEAIKLYINEKPSKSEESSKFGSSLKGKTLWDWLELLVVPLILFSLTLWWQDADKRRTSQQETDRYHQQLVKEYTNSVQVLLLDKYHHEEYKEPEISAKEVASFVKSYTATTLKALGGDLQDDNDLQQTNVITNFLRRSGIGFISDSTKQPSEICDQEINKKDGEYSGFLCGINLERANLKGIDLYKVIFGQALLSEADLSEANLENSYLRKSYLVKAILENASLVSADLIEADLRGANLTKANLHRAKLRGSKLEPAGGKNPFTKEDSSKETNLKEAILKKANLRDANLRDSDLTGADLTRANLRGANLVGVTVSFQTEFENALYDLSTQLPDKEQLKEENMLKIAPKENLSNADLRETDLIDANLKGANLTQADLTNADLTSANLTGADLTSANLRGANLVGIIIDDETIFEDAIFDEESWLSFSDEDIEGKGLLKIAPKTDLRNANLSCPDLKDDDLTKTDVLSCPNLRDADLSKADLRGANLTRADLTGANLTRADLRGADLTGAKYDQAIFESTLFGLFKPEDSKSETKITQLPFDKEEAKSKEMLEIVAKADLTGTDLSGVDLSGADLKDSVLKSVDLRGADLTGADLRRVDLTRADLRGADLTDIIVDEQTIFKDALFGLLISEDPKFDSKTTQLPFDKEEAKNQEMVEIFAGANLTGADLRKVDLQNVDLRGVNLTGANLIGADLTKTDLRGADLTEVSYNILTKFDNALFDSATTLPFEKKEARDKKMWKIVPGANLTGSDLTNADLTDADLTDADLTDADLTGADLTGADLTNANFIDAKVTTKQLAKAKSLCDTTDQFGKVLRRNCPEEDRKNYSVR